MSHIPEVSPTDPQNFPIRTRPRSAFVVSPSASAAVVLFDRRLVMLYPLFSSSPLSVSSSMSVSECNKTITYVIKHKCTGCLYTSTAFFLLMQDAVGGVKTYVSGGSGQGEIDKQIEKAFDCGRGTAHRCPC